MSIIGVVSSITKEPSQSQTGGTRSPITAFVTLDMPLQIGAFACLYWIPLSWTRLVVFSTQAV